MSDNHRLSIPEYAMELAQTAAKRSEDPYCKVGAVALNSDNRIVALGYNGLKPKFEPEPGFWDDRERRLRDVIHAEQNLCSLFTSGEVTSVATTLAPCLSCAKLLVAHGVQTVYYGAEYKRDPSGLDYLRGMGVDVMLVENS